MKDYKSTSKIKDRFNENINQRSSNDILNDPRFNVGDNIRAEYDMWSWIYAEIANLRQEVSRVALIVRLNNVNSPNYLEVYHGHLYSLLIPVSVVINQTLWIKVDRLWEEIGTEIKKYMSMRKSIQNKKIPEELIVRLDKLYRVSLLMIQKAGMGIRITTDIDLSQAIENTIVGE